MIDIKRCRLHLQVTIAGWHRGSLVEGYNVAEHRLDYIKLGEGREYNYHYNDGVSSGFDKRKFYKRPPVFNKQPYSLKNFPSPVEQIVTNEFQSHPETQTYIRQESLLPVFESHEKSVQYIPLDFHSSKSSPATAAGAQQQQQYSSPSSSSSFGHQNHGPSFTTNLAERVIQMIQLQHPSSAKNGTVGSPGSSTSSVHFQAPGQSQQYTHSGGQHPGSYQYFNAHPAPASYELVRPISNFPPPRPYIAPSLTTTKAPYLAPILLKSTSTTQATPTVTVAPARRPPYVAPTVRPNAGSGSVTNDPLLSSVSLANQLKYTSSRPSTSSRPPSSGGNRNQQQQQQQQQQLQQQQKQPYEPEFDIDIRIDLRDDSA
ncbi:hypothetical protein AND_006848 [Anopheles darlingi]|uniref:Uncharacterized protein n=1 Tax=Anopheles darlingi TaxID=43151 RepID=W5JFB5_ANODA|nr:hypothetical protein AND_006848 [Anopheles darlingi]